MSEISSLKAGGGQPISGFLLHLLTAAFGAAYFYACGCCVAARRSLEIIKANNSVVGHDLNQRGPLNLLALPTLAQRYGRFEPLRDEKQ
jgi:hypothetical protein